MSLYTHTKTKFSAWGGTAPECFLVIITDERFQNRIHQIKSLNYSGTFLFLRCSEAVMKWYIMNVLYVM